MPMAGSLKKGRQNDLVDKLRKSVHDIIPPNVTDEYLLRFLKCEGYDLRKAEKHCRYVLNVRALYRADDLPRVFVVPEIAKLYSFTGFIGFAKDGNPVRYVAVGKGDFIGFLSSMRPSDIGFYCGAIIEGDVQAARANNEKLGRSSEPKLIGILDFEDFNPLSIAHKIVIECGLDMIRMFQDVYPGVVGRVFIINASQSFTILYNIVKPVLQTDIISTLIVSSKEESTKVLLQYIDADILPAFLGGNRVDENGDPKCSSFITFGGKIPQDLYCVNHKPWLNPKEPDVEDVVIQAKETLSYCMKIYEKDTLIRVEMWSDMSIGFCVYYKRNEVTSGEKLYDHKNKEEEEMICPYFKYITHVAPVDKIMKATRPGTYIIRFDNTFSWINPKRVVFRVRPISEH